MCNPANTGYKTFWQTMTWRVSVLVWAEDRCFLPRDGKCLGLVTFRVWLQLFSALLIDMNKTDFPGKSEQGSRIHDTATRPATSWQNYSRWRDLMRSSDPWSRRAESLIADVSVNPETCMPAVDCTQLMECFLEEKWGKPSGPEASLKKKSHQ